MSKKKIRTKVITEEQPVIKEENQIKNFIIILGLMLILFALFYLLTVWIKYEKKRYTPVTEQTEINYDKILLGNIFDYSGEYFVLVVDGDDEEYLEKITSEIDMNVGKALGKKYYTVSMNDKMNAKYIGTESNLKVSNINDLKVSTTTLIHVNNKKVVNAYEGNTAIFEYLHSAVKVVK